MARKKKLRSGKPTDESPREGFSLEAEQAIDDARFEVGDQLYQYLNSRFQVFNKTGFLAADLSDGLLISDVRAGLDDAGDEPRKPKAR